MVPHDNDLNMKFATDEEYNKIWDKTPNQLRAMGIETKTTADAEEEKQAEDAQGDQIDSSANPEEDEDEYFEDLAKKKQAVQNRQIVLKEHIIDSDVEQENVTKIYFRQIAKLLQNEAKKKKKQ